MRRNAQSWHCGTEASMQSSAIAAQAGRSDPAGMRELYAGRQVLFTLDSEFETKSLLEKVVRYLAVEHSKRKIAQREARKAQEAADQEVLLKQREYLVARIKHIDTSMDTLKEEQVR